MRVNLIMLTAALMLTTLLSACSKQNEGTEAVSTPTVPAPTTIAAAATTGKAT